MDLEKRFIVEVCLKESNLLLSTFRTEERRVNYTTLPYVFQKAQCACGPNFYFCCILQACLHGDKQTDVGES